MQIFLSFLLLLLSYSSAAIVVRHDVDGKKYLADTTDFPALATLYVDGAHGTLIKPDWVVTAAHATFCINSGSYIGLNNGYHQVERVFVHNDYQPGISHDIALIKLANPVHNVKPAALYKQTDEVAKVVWFIGVGGTGSGLAGQTIDNAENSGVLRKAQNKIEQAQGPVLKFKFDSGTSALPLEGVSGGGDSGGPAYLIDNGMYTLVGISSRVEGTGIGKYGAMEVYSRVSYFTPWIDNVTTGDDSVQRQWALSKLQQLPTGLTELILPEVCSDIGLKP